MAEVPFTGVKWRGIGIPFKRGNSGYFTHKTTKDLVLSSLVHILTTPLGTRLMRPEFGSVFPKLIFEPSDQILRSAIQIYTRSSILKWEPRIDQLSIDTTLEGRTVKVKILFTIKETGERVDSYLQFQRNNLQSVRLVV